nr:MAG TPA: hypothetical protein [Caudoviricetes sp.]
MSNNWPTAPLIKVVRGREYDVPVRGDLAARTGDDEYLLATGPRAGSSISRKAPSDDIDKWEEVTAVPTAALEEFKAAWKGFGMYDPDDSQRVTDAITTILSYLPANKPSALDRAVTRVKDAGGRMIDTETTQEERLSLLLDALASVQSAARKAAPLAMVARICVDWADLENPRRDSLEAARERTKVLSNPGSFIVLSALVGDVTTALCDDFSPRHDLIDAGAYALAWAAQTIEEEDR